MSRITLMILATGLTLAACNEATEQRTADAANRAEATADAAGDRIENVADNAIASLMPAPGAQDFVNKAAKGDAFEIAAAQLAASRAQSDEVKAFATRMIKAHTDSSAKIKAAASMVKPTVKIDAALTIDQKEDLAELKKLTAARFDEEYMDGQVEAHEDALALMRSYASGGTDGRLKSAAGEIASVVEGHLKMARELDAKIDR